MVVLGRIGVQGTAFEGSRASSVLGTHKNCGFDVKRVKNMLLDAEYTI